MQLEVAKLRLEIKKIKRDHGEMTEPPPSLRLSSCVSRNFKRTNSRDLFTTRFIPQRAEEERERETTPSPQGLLDNVQNGEEEAS